MATVRDMGLHETVFISAGVGSLASAKSADWIRTPVPGIHIPDELITRLRGAADQKREGRPICVEMIDQIGEIKGIAGIHIMAYRQEETVAEIIDKSGVLGDRIPWHPGLS